MANPVRLENSNLITYLYSQKSLKDNLPPQGKVEKLIEELHHLFEGLLLGEMLPFFHGKERALAPHRTLFGNKAIGGVFEIEGKRFRLIWDPSSYAEGIENKIYKAYEMGLGPLALRVPKNYLTKEPLQKWQKEGETHKKVRHLPEVVFLYGIWLNKDSPLQAAMLLEWCPHDLFDFLLREGDLQESDQKKLIRGSLKAIGALHRAGFCHGDLNFGNFLIRLVEGKPEIVLADFAHARRFLEKESIGLSPRYQPPEQFEFLTFPEAKRKRLAVGADSFAIGAIGYMIATWPNLTPLDQIYGDQASEMYQNILNLKEGHLFPEYEQAIVEEWREKFPDLVADDEKSLSILYGRIFKVFQDETKKNLMPLIEDLEKSKDPMRRTLAKLLNLDLEERITPEKALQELMPVL